MRFAVIDVGSNTVLASIVEAHGSEVHALFDGEWMTGLGRGLARTQHLSDAGMTRVREVLTEVQREARAREAPRAFAVGTAAMRDAINGHEFARQLREELGVEIDIIDGDREARLTFSGARRGIARLDGEVSFCAIDIGGRSTEIAWGCGTVLEEAVSLPLGSVRLHEQFFDRERPTSSALAAARNHIDSTLATQTARGVPLALLAGTAQTIARVAGTAERSSLDAEDVERVLDIFVNRTADERAQLRGVPQDRADVVLSGALLLSRIVAWSRAPALYVGEGGVRWGLAYEVARAAWTGSPFPAT